MAGFGDAIKYLYEKFILRDLLSFVTPGAIVVLTAFLLFLSKPCLTQGLDTLFKYSQDMHWLLYIPLFGLFFMVGFAVQCFGEFLGLIHFSPPDEFSWPWRQRRQILRCKNWTKDKDDLWWVKYYKWEADFWQATERSETAQQGRERMVVLKQMCANGLWASLIAVVFLAIDWWCSWPYANLCVVSIVVLLLLASLFWGHRVHVLRQHAREKVIIDRWKERYAKTQNKVLKDDSS